MRAIYEVRYLNGMVQFLRRGTIDSVPSIGESLRLSGCPKTNYKDGLPVVESVIDEGDDTLRIILGNGIIESYR